MKKLRLKKWIKIAITLVVIHLSFVLWKQTGILGELAQKDTFHALLCAGTWAYLLLGQTLIYSLIWSE